MADSLQDLASGGESSDGGKSGSCSESPQLFCFSCGVSSKDPDPIFKAKGKTVPCRWGKSTKRKVKTKTGRKTSVLRRCGEWCRQCYNNACRWVKNRRYKSLLKKGGRKEVMRQIKSDLKADQDFARGSADAECASIQRATVGPTRIADLHVWSGCNLSISGGGHQHGAKSPAFAILLASTVGSLWANTHLYLSLLAARPNGPCVEIFGCCS